MRGVYSTTFLLDTGQFRTVFSQTPVHYKDSRGDYRPIDLTPRAADDGDLEVRGAVIPVSFANEAADRPPVTLETKAGPVTMNLVGASEDDAAGEERGVLYPRVLPDVSVRYAATGDGVKETIVLASSAAPSTYTYVLTHPGQTLRRGEEGEWALFGEGAGSPTLVLGPLTVYDSSRDEGDEPAFCDAARVEVTPGKGETTVSYRVPDAWLDDPARVYPVEVDPNLFSRSSIDTYIASGHPSTAFGSSTGLLAGKVSADTGTCIALIRWNAVKTAIPTGAHVSSATHSLYQYWQPSGAHNRTHLYRLSGNSTNWTESSTWNTVNIPSWAPVKAAGYQVGGTGWFDAACATVVQGWVSDTYVNRGFAVAQEAGEGASYARKFRSGEWSAYSERPKLSSTGNVHGYRLGLQRAPTWSAETVTATVARPARRTRAVAPEQPGEPHRGADPVSTARGARRRPLPRRAGLVQEHPQWCRLVHVRARTRSGQPDGYFAYQASSAVGSEAHDAALLENCLIADDHGTVTSPSPSPRTGAHRTENQIDTPPGDDLGAAP